MAKVPTAVAEEEAEEAELADWVALVTTWSPNILVVETEDEDEVRKVNDAT